MILITIFVFGITAIWIKQSAPKLKSNISAFSERIDRGISHKFMLILLWQLQCLEKSQLCITYLAL